MASRPDEACHGGGESQEQPTTPHHGPSAPSDDSGNCPAHVDVSVVFPPTMTGHVGLYHISQPVEAEPVLVAVFYFDRRGEIRAEEKSFKSPPSRALNSVLRI
ncbi:MAG TPA: hypothetical protein VJQ56_03630 [Blastocatellia bacterium]|nr:hypothetical protein [Blastocatellia bacterium]